MLLPDTTPGMGFGHLARCLALAEEWTRRGGSVATRSEVTDPSWLERCRLAGARLVEDRHWEPDDFAWAVMDGYALEPAIQTRARLSSRLAAIDDHGHSRWTVPVDLVVDPNVGARRSGRGRTLAGPRYALVRREVLAHAGALPRPRTVVIVGGGSPRTFVVTWMERVARALPYGLQVDIIRGGRNAPAAMAAAELVVTAAGTTMLEAFALGRPVIGFTWADNQRPGAEHMRAAGAQIVGDVADVQPEFAAAKIVELLDDPVRLSELEHLGSSIVDGRGARRVVTQLVAQLITLRPAALGDADRLWRWANDPDVRAGAFSNDPIPWNEHVRWMTAKLADPLTDMVIAHHGGSPFGQVRFDRLGTTAHVDLSIIRSCRGRGLGGPLLVAATDRYLGRHSSVDCVRATVRLENTASHVAFLDADYQTDGSIGDFPAPHLRYSRYRNDAGPHE